MELGELTVKNFVAELESDSPAPGGGSVAALCASLGAALAGMVAGLTLGREKYRDSQEKMETCAARAKALRGKFLELMERDTESFNAFMAARKLPKDTDEEKAARAEAIEKATKYTSSVPLDVVLSCEELAELALDAAKYGNPNAVTDAGVAGLLSLTAARSAAYNVRINLSGVKDMDFVEDYRKRMAKSLETTAKLAAEVESIVEAAL